LNALVVWNAFLVYATSVCLIDPLQRVLYYTGDRAQARNADGTAIHDGTSQEEISVHPRTTYSHRGSPELVAPILTKVENDINTMFAA
jgi:hypothetical protein